MRRRKFLRRGSGRVIWFAGLISFPLAACALFACAHAPRNSAAEDRTIDAVLPSGRNLFLFDFARARYQKWADGTPPADSGSAAAAWLALPAPSFPFAPMQAVWGPNGNFFLLDRVGKRLVLYDTGAQFLSSLPLPAEIRDKPLDRMQVFWNPDGVFSFLDLGEGWAWRFEEARAGGAGEGPGGDWRPGVRVRLPVGLDACVWKPFSRDLCCTLPRGNLNATPAAASAGGACFDNYFNPRGAWRGSPPEETAAGEGGHETATELRVRRTDRDGLYFILPAGSCFYPDKAALGACPSGAETPGP